MSTRNLHSFAGENRRQAEDPPRVAPTWLSRPSLLLGGAPKCATSTLFNLLAEHPSIHASLPKETFYFVDIDYPLQPSGGGFHELGFDAYARFFQKPSTGVKRMEGTTHYLFQETPRKIVSEHARDCVTCFMVREPAERMHSSFMYAQQNRAHIKPELTFGSYVDHLMAGQMTKLRSFFTSEAIFRIFCRELSHSRYVEHLMAWKAVVGCDRLLVFRFEDFVKDPSPVVRSICRSLGVSEHGLSSATLRRDKPTVSNRSWRLHRVATQLAGRLPKDSAIKSRLRGLYRSLQRRGGRKTDPQSRKAMEALREYFRGPNEELQKQFSLGFNQQ